MSDLLPESLLEQILIRLPPTTLVRLRSVCKTWHSLITSHSFISSHLQCSLSNSTINPLLLIRQSSRWSLLHTTPFSSRLIAKISTQRPYNPYSYSFDIVQSLHGIVCLAWNFPAWTLGVTLWNPSIRRYLTLHPPTANGQASAIGFGFDSKNHDYKVIRIFHIGHVELYSLNSGAWKVIDFTYLPDNIVCYSRTKCFVNGNVHWIMANRHLNNNVTNTILIFNVEEDKFNMIDLPPELVTVKFTETINDLRLRELDNLRLTVIEGCLSVLHYCSKDECDVWVMREYNVAESWTKISTLDLQGQGCVFGLGTSAKVLMVRSRFWCSLIDTKSDEITDLSTRGNAITACEYTGSLVLLDTQSYAIPCPVNMSQAKKRKRNHDSNCYTFPQLFS